MNYFSVDVETTGLIPGHNDLLSVGVVHVESEATFHEIIVDTNYPGLTWDTETWNWWNDIEQRDAKTRMTDLCSTLRRHAPYEANLMNVSEALYDWLLQYNGDKFFVAWPASFDYPYIQHLFLRANLGNLFNYRTIDIKSYACGKLGLPFNAGHNEFPEWLYEKPEYPHDALSDAIAQANVFKRLIVL